MITSASNQQLRRIRRLLSRAKYRKAEKMFVAEGPKMAEEVPSELRSGVYCSESFAAEKKNQDILHRLSPEIVSENIFRNLSDTQTPQGILAVVRQQTYTLEDLCCKKRPLLILESVQDPGNLGTMFRTGEGAGIGGIIMNRETVDIYNPKTVRSTMGSLFRVPFYITDDLPGIIAELKTRDYRTYAAHLRGKGFYTEQNYRIPSAFLIGNEGNGLSDRIADLADCYLRIPMEGSLESLNAAVAAALLMYEAKRQRDL